MPHINHPSRQSVDAALQQIENEEMQRAKVAEASVQFYRRESKPVVNWQMALVGVMLGAAAVVGVVYYVITSLFGR